MAKLVNPQIAVASIPANDVRDFLVAARSNRTVTADNAKVEIERRMSELVDLLAIFLDADIDPRAWRQLLTYAPKQ